MPNSVLKITFPNEQVCFQSLDFSKLFLNEESDQRNLRRGPKVATYLWWS